MIPSLPTIYPAFLAESHDSRNTYDSKMSLMTVETLMMTTFPFRRNDILNGKKELVSISSKYPFIKHFC